MDHTELLAFLESVRAGRTTPSEGVERLKNLPFEDLGFAKIDHHRGLRLGYPEVILARGKTPAQVAGIVHGMLGAKSTHNILITRASETTFDAVAKLTRRSLRRASATQFFPLSGTITIRRNTKVLGKGLILVVTAGTSDIPVAEEALITAEMLGNRAEALYDVGVAGLHRLIHHRPKLAEARVVICVAGMEGALPSVVAGLVGAPVIAVPTSIGYGASFGGVAALLSMLNSCASNVSVVNIDNGFGAACVASSINRL
jgi:NCAIR mutase (PurE)-related protein